MKKNNSLDKVEKKESEDLVNEVDEELNEDRDKELLRKVEIEYRLAKSAADSKLEESLKRLKLYNNQKRDKKKVGDPLLFSVMQTVVAALYDDTLSVEFVGRSPGDEDSGDNLTHMARYDHEIMEKAQLDYFWIWDACFFGKGFVKLFEFDKDEKSPVPELIDPMAFLIDPSAKSINGVANRGAARFLGWEALTTKYELESNLKYKNLEKLKQGVDRQSLVYKARDQRNEAAGLTTPSTDTIGESEELSILKWFTVFEGKRIYVEVDAKFNAVIFESLVYDPKRKNEKENGLGLDRWPVVQRSVYPVSHEFYGTSIPDIVEDKQRMRAILQNLAIAGLKTNVYPHYLFDPTAIKNRADLQPGFNKFTPVKPGMVNNAVAPLRKDRVDLQLYANIMLGLDESVQKATATPDMQQGALSNEQRTLGELNLVASKVDVRHSLTSKVFGWSEREFWKLWYQNYKVFFDKGMGEKIVRISGVLGRPYRPITSDSIKLEADPDIKIEAKSTSEYKKMKKMQGFSNVLSIALKVPDTNMRYAIKKLAELSGMDSVEVDMLLPPNIDELRAEEENRRLNADLEIEAPAQYDNHQEHLLVHASLNDTPEAKAHIEAHKEAMRLKKDDPSLFPQDQQQQPGQPGQAQGQQAAPDQNFSEPKPSQLANQFPQ